MKNGGNNTGPGGVFIRVMTCSIIPLAVVTLFTSPLGAQDFEGLYRPHDDPKWSCQMRDLGMDRGALGFIDNTFYGVENTCKIISTHREGIWTSVSARCNGEGEVSIDSFRVRPIDGGLEFNRAGYSYVWDSCASGANALQSAQSVPRNGLWTSGWGMGWSEAITRDDLGNSVNFSCNEGGSPTNVLGQIFIKIGGQSPAAGEITFVVDGEKIPMTSEAPGDISISYCNACAANYSYLREKIAAGHRLTVIPANGPSVVFSLRGSRKALELSNCSNF